MLTILVMVLVGVFVALTWAPVGALSHQIFYKWDPMYIVFGVRLEYNSAATDILLGYLVLVVYLIIWVLMLACWIVYMLCKLLISGVKLYCKGVKKLAREK